MAHKLTMDLKRSKLEGQSSNGPKTSANGILISLEELYSEPVRKELPVDEREEMDASLMDDAADRGSTHQPSWSKQDQSAKKKSTRGWVRTSASLGWKH